MQSDISSRSGALADQTYVKHIQRVRKRYNQLCEADTKFHGGMNLGPQVDDEERITYLFLQGMKMRDADMCVKRPHMLLIGDHDREPEKDTILQYGSPPGTDQALPEAETEGPSVAADAELQKKSPFSSAPSAGGHEDSVASLSGDSTGCVGAGRDATKDSSFKDDHDESAGWWEGEIAPTKRMRGAARSEPSAREPVELPLRHAARQALSASLEEGQSPEEPRQEKSAEEGMSPEQETSPEGEKNIQQEESPGQEKTLRQGKPEEDDNNPGRSNSLENEKSPDEEADTPQTQAGPGLQVLSAAACSQDDDVEVIDLRGRPWAEIAALGARQEELEEQLRRAKEGTVPRDEALVVDLQTRIEELRQKMLAKVFGNENLPKIFAHSESLMRWNDEGEGGRADGMAVGRDIDGQLDATEVGEVEKVMGQLGRTTSGM